LTVKVKDDIIVNLLEGSGADLNVYALVIEKRIVP
jgi:hypothetical protein